MKHWMTYVKAAYEVILIAEEKSSINLEHEIEAFLVHTFARYMERPNIPTTTVAEKMLTAVGEHGELRKQHLLEVAEECLIIDGLELNSRRWPCKDYYSTIGKLALEHRAWSCRPPELFYHKLSSQFHNMGKVLNGVKV